MAKIAVKRAGDDELEVVVRDRGRATSHRVRVTEHDRATYGGEATKERLVEESFRFLLEREKPGDILSRFEIGIIGRYFPEYTGEIRRRLKAG
jgi:hypothetical protein